jgi:hypothetical protein
MSRPGNALFKLRRGGLLALSGIGFGVVIVVSGMRYDPPRVLAHSPPICGTIYQNGKPVSDAGPCPAIPSETPVGGGWVWEPFWLH